MSSRYLIRHGWLPDQHGAWAMTLAPLVLGIALSGGSPVQIPLSIAWLGAYLLFSVYTLWNKSRRHERYTPALLTYAFITTAAAAVVLTTHPTVWIWGVPLLGCFLWALSGSKRGRDRSLPSRLAAIFAACLMTPVAYSLGSNPDEWARVTVATFYLGFYLVGTVPYVRTMIRKRGDETWLRGSIIFHSSYVLAAIVAAIFGLLTWWAVAIATLVAMRAWALPLLSMRADRPIRPLTVGVIEFVMTLLVFAGAFWGTPVLVA